MLIQIIFSLSKSVLLSKLIFQLLMASLLVVFFIVIVIVIDQINQERSKGRNFPENITFGVLVEAGCEKTCSIRKT